MGRKAVGPVCCVMHVKEPRTLIVKEKGLAPVFLEAAICAIAPGVSLLTDMALYVYPLLLFIIILNNLNAFSLFSRKRHHVII